MPSINQSLSGSSRGSDAEKKRGGRAGGREKRKRSKKRERKREQYQRRQHRPPASANTTTTSIERPHDHNSLTEGSATNCRIASANSRVRFTNLVTWSLSERVRRPKGVPPDECRLRNRSSASGIGAIFQSCYSPS